MTTHKKVTGARDSRGALPRQEALVADLRSRDGMVRLKAREALTSMGKRAVRQLIPLLKDPEDDVRWEAAKALADIADARAASDLVAALEDENGDVRWLAAQGLIAIGRDALVPLLETLIERPSSVWLREGAHHVLHDLAKADLKDLLTPVVAALDGVDPEIGVHWPALKALQGLRG
jgi:HEAT repeat protein